MRLPFLRPKPPPVAGKTTRLQGSGGSDDGVSVEAARTRARRRLMGALVLLVIGVLGFPVLFETQPRPLPLETPIEPARREPMAAAPPAVISKPAATKPAPAPDLLVEAPAEPTPAGPAMASVPVPVARPAPPAPEVAVAATANPASSNGHSSASGSGVNSNDNSNTNSDGARARALLDGGAASAPAGRFIVQVGAFSDANALRDARAKVEKLGLKTYTQVIDSDAGKRTRVRVGPFATRDEADAAAGKLKRGGMAANILVL